MKMIEINVAARMAMLFVAAAVAACENECFGADVLHDLEADSGWVDVMNLTFAVCAVDDTSNAVGARHGCPTLLVNEVHNSEARWDHHCRLGMLHWRSGATELVARTGDYHAVPRLLKLLDDPERFAAAHSALVGILLGTIGEEREGDAAFTRWPYRYPKTAGRL
jgi:hypothetical protein